MHLKFCIVLAFFIILGSAQYYVTFNKIFILPESLLFYYDGTYFPKYEAILLMIGMILPNAINVIKSPPPYKSAKRNGLWSLYIQEKTNYQRLISAIIFLIISMVIQSHLGESKIISTIHFILILLSLIECLFFIVTSLAFIRNDIKKQDLVKYLEDKIIRAIKVTLIKPHNILSTGYTKSIIKAVVENFQNVDIEEFYEETNIYFEIYDKLFNDNSLKIEAKYKLIELMQSDFYHIVHAISEQRVNLNDSIFNFVDRFIERMKCNFHDNVDYRFFEKKLISLLEICCVCLRENTSSLAQRIVEKGILNSPQLQEASHKDSYSHAKEDKDEEEQKLFYIWQDQLFAFLCAFLERKINHGTTINDAEICLINNILKGIGLKESTHCITPTPLFNGSNILKKMINRVKVNNLECGNYLDKLIPMELYEVHSWQVPSKSHANFFGYLLYALQGNQDFHNLEDKLRIKQYERDIFKGIKMDILKYIFVRLTNEKHFKEFTKLFQ